MIGLPAAATASPGPAPPTDWSPLVRRMADGDQAALAAFYDETSARAYGLAQHILGDADDAEDVLLDAYSQVWRSAASFDPSRGSALAWLLVIVRSRAMDHLRRRSRQVRREQSLAGALESEGAAVAPDEGDVDAALRTRIRRALADLPAEQREPIELAYFGGLSQSEIAERLGQPLGTIKTRIRLGMTKLRAALGAVRPGGL